MLSPAKLGVLGFLSLFSVLTLSGLSGTTVFATEASETVQPTESANQSVPLEIVPICSDAVEKISYWKVTNKNSDFIQIDWDNFENGFTGTYSAPSAESVMETAYVVSDPNNTTRFEYQNITTQTNAQVAPCEATPEPQDECVDGRIQDNLFVEFLNNNTASITTRDGRLLCNDVTIFFSSYLMPYNYNGQGFENNTTAYPQSLFDSVSATLVAGTTGTKLLNVDLPDRCQNAQIDVYYAPEIREVGANGHGTQNILSLIIQKAEDCSTGGSGSEGGDVVPTPLPVIIPNPAPSASPVLPVGGSGTSAPTVNKLPAELPRTGSNSNPPYFIVGMLMSLLTYAFVYRLTNTVRE